MIAKRGVPLTLYFFFGTTKKNDRSNNGHRANSKLRQIVSALQIEHWIRPIQIDWLGCVGGLPAQFERSWPAKADRNAMNDNKARLADYPYISGYIIRRAGLNKTSPRIRNLPNPSGDFVLATAVNRANVLGPKGICRRVMWMTEFLRRSVNHRYVYYVCFMAINDPAKGRNILSSRKPIPSTIACCNDEPNQLAKSFSTKVPAGRSICSINVFSEAFHFNGVEPRAFPNRIQPNQSIGPFLSEDGATQRE